MFAKVGKPLTVLGCCRQEEVRERKRWKILERQVVCWAMSHWIPDLV